MTYPARCPGCGSPATNTLIADPSVPIYLCGAYATMGTYPCVRPEPPAEDWNLVRADSADMRELLDIVDMTTVAVMRAAG